MNKKTCPTRNELSGYANGTLPPAAADEVTQHIAGCAACEDTLESIGQASDSLVRQIQAKPAAERYVEEAACRQAVNKVEGHAPGAKGSAAESASSASPSPGRAAPERVKTLNRNEFVEFVTTSGLITSDELTAALKGRPAAETADAPALAKTLIALEKLTKYQAAAIYQGKGKSLFYGDYLVLDRIGAGGMGQVFKARHRRMDRIVALKVMSPTAIKNADAVRRFEREVRAAAKLAHPNVVHAYDAGVQGDLRYLVMEYVEGCDLSALMKQQPKLGIKQVCGFIEQAARGFAAAHAKGIVHRDVKPGNLLIDKNGVVKVLDMGLARFDDEGIGGAMTEGELTQSGSVMGTVDYMAPEQALDTRHADAKSDVYGLGCTLYRALAGEAAYGGRTLVEKILAHRDHPVPSVRKLRPDAPPQLDILVQRMLAKHPSDRPTMQEAADALAAIDPSAAKSSPLDFALVPTNVGLPTPSATFATGVLPTAVGPAGMAPQGSFPQPGFGAPPVNYPGTNNTFPPSMTAQNPSLRTAGAAPPRRRSNIAILAAAGAGGLLILAGIWVYIKNKEGQTVASIEVPDGGSVQMGGPDPTGTGATPIITPAIKTTATPAPLPPGAIALPASSIRPSGVPLNRDDEVRVAKFVLDLGGFLNIVEPGQQPRAVKGAAELPPGPFTVNVAALSRTKVTDKDLEQLLPASQLADVSLYETAITDAGLDVIVKLPLLRGFTYSPTISGRITDAGAKKLEAMTYLQGMRLDGTEITPAAAEALHKKLPHCNITISGKNYPSDGLISRLQNGATPTPETAVAFAPSHSTSAGLGVPTLYIDPEIERRAALFLIERGGRPTISVPQGPMTVIVRAEQLPTTPFMVHDIDLNNVDFTDQDLEKLRGLGNVRNLQMVRTKITDAGLKIIATFPTLQSLFLANTAVTDDGLQALAGHPKLSGVNANLTKVTAAGAERLHKATPNCQIYYDGGNTAGVRLPQPVYNYVFRSSGGGAPAAAATPSAAPQAAGEVVCAKLIARRDPVGLSAAANHFKGPKIDRDGANGFTIKAPADWRTAGTSWTFDYRCNQWDNGIQMIHPVGDGHIRMVLMTNFLGLAPGGPWGIDGIMKYYLPADKKLEPLASTVFPLNNTDTYRVKSSCDAAGNYTLSINDQVIVKRQVQSVGPQQMKPPFEDPKCPAVIAVGDAALIMGPAASPGAGATIFNEANDVRLATAGPALIASATPAASSAPIAVTPEAERAAAVSLLANGAKLKFDASGVKSELISSPTQLPSGPFRVFEVSFYQVKTATDETIAPLQYLTSLETLNLHQTIVTDEGLAVLKDLKKLSSVNISSTLVHGSGIRYLVGLPELKYLAISDKSIDPSTSQWLAQLKGLEKFDAVRTQLSDLSWVAETPRLREINVGGSRVSDISALAALPNLKTLNIWRSFIVDADLAAFRNSKELESINVVETDISDAGLSNFEGLPKLKLIDAVDTYVTADGAAKLRAKMPNLEIRIRTKAGSPPSQRRSPPPLPVEAATVATSAKPSTSLSAAPFDPAFERQVAQTVIGRGGRVTVKTAAGSRSSPILKLDALPAEPFQLLEVNFYQTQGVFTDKDIANYDRLSAVESLGLGPSQITDQGIAVLARIPSLKFLNLGSSNVEGPGLIQLVNLPNLTNLTFGDHSLNNKAVPVLAQFKNLTDLNLWGTKVSDISFVRSMPKLTSFLFNGGTFTDFSPYASLPELKDVDLRGSYIVDDDLKYFSGLKNLRSLNFGNTDISDAGLVHLEGATSLIRLALSDTYVTEAAAARLRQKLPGCQITVKTKPGAPPSRRRTPPTPTVAVSTSVPRGVPTAVPALPSFVPRPAVKQERQAVPSESDLQKALKTVKDTFAAEYAAAKSAEQKAALAAKLIDTAKQTLDDPASRYTLYNEARTLALDGASLEVLNDALNPMIDEFIIDAPTARLDAWNALVKKPRVDPSTSAQLVKLGNALFDQATIDADFDVGKRYGDFVLAATRKLANSGPAVKSATDRNTALAARQKEWPTIIAAIAKLKTSPDDAEANLALARYLALAADDWPAAFPLYAKSGDAALAAAAEKSLTAIAGTLAPAAAGDVWWDAAQALKPPQKTEFAAAADFWYRRAAPQLTGLSRTRVQKRLEELESQLPSRVISATTLPTDGAAKSAEPNPDLDRALPNRNFGDKAPSTPAPNAGSATSTSQSAAPSTASAPNSNSGPSAAPFAATDERLIADYYLNIKGTAAVTLTLQLPDQSTATVSTSNVLPAGPIKIIGLKLTSPYARDRDLYPLRNLPSLKTLALSNCPFITRDGFRELADVRGLTELRIEAMAGFGDESVPFLLKMTDLETLMFTITPLTDVGLAQLDVLPKLKMLGLTATKVDGSGFASWGPHPDLAQLYMHQSNLNDAGLKQIERFDSLAMLVIGKTPVTDEGVIGMKKLPQLRTLFLRGSSITDRALPALAERKNLTSFAASSMMTPAAVDAFLRAVPGCRLDR